jgi:large subunit ribosomal protein L18
MRIEQKQKLKQLRRWRIRKKVQGTAERPRMSVFFSGRHVYVQFIDDLAGRTLAAASSRTAGSKGAKSEKGAKGVKASANVAGAQSVGKAAAEAARGKGIEKVVFDRAGARYHGKVKALADAAREAGLQF